MLPLIKHPPMPSFSLPEKLNLYYREELKDIALDLGLQRVSTLRKAELVERITAHLLRPEALRERLAVINERSMALFLEGGEAEADCSEGRKHDAAVDLDVLELGYVFSDGRYRTLSDVWELYQTKIAGEAFEAYRERALWVRKCFWWMDHLAGYVHMDVALEIVNTKEGFGIDEEELMRFVLATPQDQRLVGKEAFGLMSVRLMANFQEFKALLEAQHGKPYYVPTAREVEEFYETGALLSNQPYREMRRFLRKDMRMGASEAENLLLELWDRISLDNDFHGTTQWFLGQFEFRTEAQLRKAVDLFMAAANGTNLITNRGFSPGDARMRR